MRDMRAVPWLSGVCQDSERKGRAAKVSTPALLTISTLVVCGAVAPSMFTERLR